MKSLFKGENRKYKVDMEFQHTCDGLFFESKEKGNNLIVTFL